MRVLTIASITVIIVITIILTPAAAFAHVAGQPPFFKINGEYSQLYPVPTSSFLNFNLPQDGAPANYLVNQKLHMEIDSTQLPVPPEIIKQSQFAWNFGDGSSGAGLTNDHTYTKMGSYFIDIYVDDGTTPTPQIIEKVLVNILPSSGYQLPRAVIKINGQESKDPLTDVLKSKFDNTPVQFDAGSSTANSSRIVSYFWDFGDQNSSDQPKATHTYKQDLAQVFPVLRVKDANGFIADSFVELQNQTLQIGQTSFNQIQNQLPKPTPKSAVSSQLNKSLIGVVAIIAVIILFRYLSLRKKRIQD